MRAARQRTSVKPVQEFAVSGDYAFERYIRTSTDTPVGGGKPVINAGWDFRVYHRDADGVWRVARDAFGPITRKR